MAPLIVPTHVAERQRARHAGRPYGVVRVAGRVVAHVRTQWDLTRPHAVTVGPAGFMAWRYADRA